MPTISIITPAYNCEKYLEEAVDSVLSQTMTDWEMLIIDDCSVDNTYSCMQKLAQRDSRIRIFRNMQNAGAAATRNYGIRQARGRWIAFLDSDDLWRTDKLQKQMELLDKYPEASFLFTGSAFIEDDGIKIFEKMREIRSDEISDKVAEYFENMTENDHMQVELEEEVSNRAYYIFSENSEVQKLTKRDREIRRVPEELRDVIFNYEPRDDFSQKEIKELLKIKRKLDDYYDMAHKQAISEIASEKGMTEKEVSRVKIISGDLFMSSEKLLEEAKKECFE